MSAQNNERADVSKGMMDLFPGSYRLSADALADILSEATIAFDANVLLHLYRYGPDSREQLFQALERVGERLWIPFQVAEEFHRNRESVIAEQDAPYNSLWEAFAGVRKKLGTLKHPFGIDMVKVESIATDAEVAIKKILADTQSSRISVVDDAILTRLTAIVGNKLGNRPTHEQLVASYSKAEDRFARSVPPGYEDAKSKDKPERYGDYLIWSELLEHAAATKRPMVLISDDRKDDWWCIQHGKRIGPRRELIAEMKEYAGVDFHLYMPQRFLEYAQANLGIKADVDVIDEVRHVSEESVELEELFDELLDIGWSVGMTHHGLNRVRLLLRPWPDTWTTEETSETIWAEGPDHRSALRHAIAQARLRRAKAAP